MGECDLAWPELALSDGMEWNDTGFNFLFELYYSKTESAPESKRDRNKMM